MKKRTHLLLSVFLLCIQGTSAQSLSGTTWAMFEGSELVAFNHFESGIHSYSRDNITYTNVSTYTQSASSFTIVDLPPENSCGTVKGRYTFVIQNNVLKFTLVSDACSGRMNALVYFYWSKQTVGIREYNFQESGKIYPNPTTGLLTIEAEEAESVYVTNVQGQIVKKYSLISQTIDLNSLIPGLYFIDVLDTNRQLLFRKKVVLE